MLSYRLPAPIQHINLFFPFFRNIKLRAVWRENSYQVTYHGADEKYTSVTDPVTKTYRYSELVDTFAPAKEFTLKEEPICSVPVLSRCLRHSCTVWPYTAPLSTAHTKQPQHLYLSHTQSLKTLPAWVWRQKGKRQIQWWPFIRRRTKPQWTLSK